MPHHGKRHSHDNDDESTSNSSLSDYDDDYSNKSHSDDEKANRKKCKKQRRKFTEMQHSPMCGKKKKSLTGGATGTATGGMPNKPPKKDNPLKKELSNPQGLDFASQMGSLMAQPKTIELLPLNNYFRCKTGKH